MKYFFLVFALAFSVTTYSQIYADPALKQTSFENLSSAPIDDTMGLGAINQLIIPIDNHDLANGLPAGSCKIKIGLGTKLVLDPSFQLNAVNTSQYFQWTSEFSGGQVQITGELKSPLPANFTDIAKFNVKGSILGYSTVTVNFLITNHNTPVILSDEDPTNNTSFRRYKIIEIIPVKIFDIAAVNKNCGVKLSFRSENEINLKQYDIELSTNGTDFKKFGYLPATGSSTYQYEFPLTEDIIAPILYMRIKSVDMDGEYDYTRIVTVAGTCSNNLELSLYPNPANTFTENVCIKAVKGILNGKYDLQLYNNEGQLIDSKKLTFINQSQFNYPIYQLPKGQYLLKLTGNTSSTTFKFVKL